MKHPHFFRINLFLLATLIFGSTGVLKARAGELSSVFSQIDENAEVVLVVRGLRNLSDKIHMLAAKLQLESQLPPDPLVIVKMMTGVAQGVNDQGSLAMVVTNVSQVMRNQADPRMLLLIPVTDYQTFLANFAGGQATDNQDVMRITLGGKPAFTKSLKGYALVGERLDAVQQYKAANQAAKWASNAGAVSDRYLKQSEILVYVNMAPLAESFNLQMNQMLNHATEVATDNPATAEYWPLVEYLMNTTRKGLHALISDTQAVVLGLSIREAGLGVGGSVQFREGSPLARIFKQTPTGTLALNRLPQDPWVSLSSGQLSHLDIKEIKSLVLAMIPPNDMLPAAAMAPVAALRQAIQSLNMGESYQQAQYVSDKGELRMASVMLAKDAGQIFETSRQLIKLYGNLFDQIPLFFHTENEFPLSLSYEENALKVRDLSVDRFAITGKGKIAETFTQQLGSPSFKLYLTHTHDAMIYTTADETLLERTIAAADENKSLHGIKDLEAIRKELPANRMQETYLDLSNYMQQMQRTMMKQPNQMQMAMMLGMFQLPPGTPPVAISMFNQQGGVGYHTHLPMALLISLKNTGMAMMGPMFGSGIAH